MPIQRHALIESGRVLNCSLWDGAASAGFASMPYAVAAGGGGSQSRGPGGNGLITGPGGASGLLAGGAAVASTAVNTTSGVGGPGAAGCV